MSVLSAPFRQNMPIAVWLSGCMLMVLAMMAIGAITRLTESGLSMVEWRPLMGWLPPLSDSEWQRVFDLYQQTSQYSLMNSGMSLQAFKEIFFWEYIHRLWGRLIGVAYAVPFFAFLLMGKLPKEMRVQYFIALVMGGLQGGIGWWMVKSGFVDRIEVSQYRLAVHLGMAFVILGYLFTLFLSLSERTCGSWLNPVSIFVILILITIVSGALVAGLNAGFMFNSWPLMDGNFIPAGYWQPALGPRNIFENMATVQFNHRTMAYSSFLLVGGGYFYARKHYRPEISRAFLVLWVMLFLQICLGILTVLYVVPINLAVLHQLGAGFCFLAVVYLFWQIRLTKAQ